MWHNHPIRASALVLAASLAVLLLPGLVMAHAELKTPSPADKSTVTVPVSVVSGVYTEAMTPFGSSLVVKNGVNSVVAEGTVDPADATRMVATPATPLGTGSYLVQWTSVATDGHVDRGTWTFKVAVAPTPSPTPVATPAPTAGQTAAASPTPTPVAVTPVPSTAPTAAPSAGGDSSGSGGDVILPIIVALVILGAGAAYLLSRRGRPPAAT